MRDGLRGRGASPVRALSGAAAATPGDSGAIARHAETGGLESTDFEGPGGAVAGVVEGKSEQAAMACTAARYIAPRCK